MMTGDCLVVDIMQWRACGQVTVKRTDGRLGFGGEEKTIAAWVGPDREIHRKTPNRPLWKLIGRRNGRGGPLRAGIDGCCHARNWVSVREATADALDVSCSRCGLAGDAVQEP